ncbi:MAG: hypothetical protein LBH61_06555 [Dysgonamonadaceae bacterium]|jgi:hypothetical protein|nr:hypothetical protein [Dysgonamonadaceae bacterium]
MEVPEKYYDEIFEFKGQWDVPSKCGLRIRKQAGKTLVLVTELYQDNPGTSVTYAGRSLADQVCEAKGLNPAEIIYIECNPGTQSKLSFYEEEYFQVTFNGAAPAVYRPLRKEEIAEWFDAQ